MPNILVVDDDIAIRNMIAASLHKHGFGVAVAAGAGEMDQVLRESEIDLILLDVMMPGEDGLSICRRIAGADGPAVIMLSALGEEPDRIAGLDLGASHYLPKPCSAREIVAHVRAALRARGNGAEPASRRVFRFASWKIDLNSHELIDPDGILIDLTDGEFAVLRAFVERPRRVLSREMLLETARGPDSNAFDRAIDVQVSRLRRKLRAPGDDVIRTVRNEGYLFVPEVHAE